MDADADVDDAPEEHPAPPLLAPVPALVLDDRREDPSEKAIDAALVNKLEVKKMPISSVFGSDISRMMAACRWVFCCKA